MAKKIKLDSGGINEVLNSAPVRAELKRMGDSVASKTEATVKGNPVPVDAKEYSGTVKGRKRPVVIVAIKHVGGAAIEAKRGSLSRGAAAAGIKIKRKE